MKVTYANNKLAKLINDEKKLIKKYGPKNARLIIRRLDQLKAMDNFGDMVRSRLGRCHRLTGNLKGRYALDLDHPDRLIIQPVFDEKIDFSKVNLHEIREVIIEEVKDYHGQ